MTEKLSPDLMRGSLDLMVLAVLAEGPMYGYRIAQALEESTRGMVQVKAGTLYPLLHRLKDDGLIRSRWDHSTGRKRKWYELTAAGRRRLKQQARQWSAYAECLQRLLAPVLQPGPA